MLWSSSVVPTDYLRIFKIEQRTIRKDSNKTNTTKICVQMSTDITKKLKIRISTSTNIQVLKRMIIYGKSPGEGGRGKKFPLGLKL